LLVTPGQITTRIGVTISGKVGNAVVRNRLKRWVREWLRRHRAEWPAAAELVLVGKPSGATAPHEAVATDLALLMRRARGLRP
jgi:ribonuclease P protein component